MKWTFNEPKSGDMIRVCLGDFYHYGIYVSDDEIIQFGPPPTSLVRKDEDIEVEVTDIQSFLCGKFLETGEVERKERKNLKQPSEIIACAKSRIGDKGYNILYNNCEHFVYECVLGIKYCSQTEKMRKLWKATVDGRNK